METDATSITRGRTIFSANHDCFLLSTTARQGPANEVLSVLELKRKSPLYNQFTRKLVNECHGVFLSSYKMLKDYPENAQYQIVMNISQKYRSVLLACIEDLSAAQDYSSSSEDDIANCLSIFSEIELVWHLVELLLFDMKSSCLVVYRLVEWIQWHFTEPCKRSNEISEDEFPHHHEAYWDTIIQFVLQGSISYATSLLKQHEDSQREDFHSIDELLRKMPLYHTTSTFSWNEFQIHWRRWQDECKRRLAEGEFDAEENLNIICKILCGDHSALNEKSALCTSWYHLLVSFLLYTDPCISISSLGQMAQSFCSNITPNWDFTVLDKAILAVMEFDIIKLVDSACSFKDDSWFAAHIADLLYRGMDMNTNSVSHAHSLRNFVLMNYAQCLMIHPSMWEIGVDYLDQCDEQGREFLELHLRRVPLDSELKAQKVLHLAKQRNLDTLVKTVCKIMSMRAIKNEMFGTALKWVVQSKDAKFANILANRWVQEYTETGKFHCFDILKNLGFCMLVSDKLTFLGKYCEFHKFYQKKEFKECASLLVSLLSSGLVPKTFQLVMLLDALPLLELPQSVFSMEETPELIACLQNLFDDGFKEEEKSAFKKKERLIRLALTKNLSKSFLCENSVNR